VVNVDACDLELVVPAVESGQANIGAA